jgi:dTDP-glucose 4,6-dehydratase
VRLVLEEHPDWAVTVLDALTYAGNPLNFPERSLHEERFSFWYGNVTNGELVNKLVAECDVVVHFAAESHVARSIFDNRIFFETDVLGTQCVANAVLKSADTVERFIHISTSEVYGTAVEAPMSEDHPLNPKSPYAAAKAGADRLVYSYINTYDVPAVIVRPFNNYGPSQHLEKCVPRFITSCLLDEPVTVHGDGSASRDWLYVEDCCRGVMAAVTGPFERIRGEVVNLGTGRDIAVIDIARKVVDAMGKSRDLITHIGNRPGQVERHISSTEKSKRVLDWKAEVDFDSGLERTIRWYRDNPDVWQSQRWLRHVPVMTAKGNVEMH